MDIKYKKIKIVWAIGVGILLAIYFGIFLFLNLAKYEQHVDSDIAAEALLAREIWEEKTLTPDTWISSTERRILAMPAIAAPFYGLTGSMQMAVGIACVLLAAVFFFVFYCFLKKCGVSTLGTLTGLLIICALPINGIRNEGQMVPFLALLLYLFAEYYVFHCILLLLSINFYIHLKEKGAKREKTGVKDVLSGLILFGLTAVLSLGGQRCFQMVVLPLLVYEVVTLFMETKGFTLKVARERMWTMGYVFASLVASMLSVFYDRQANYAMYLQQPSEIMSRMFVTVPATILEGFGIAGNAKLGSFASLMQLLVWAFLVLVVWGVVYILRKRNNVPSLQKESMLILLTSLGVTAAIVCITTAEAAHNYFMVSWIIAVLAVVVVVDNYMLRKSLFSHMILLAICGFALLNLKYTWFDAITTTDNLEEYEEVSDYLAEQEISYGYAEFWDAGRISLIGDGAVTMGHSYVIEDLQMYWWLTSMNWYPPNLPADMKTAYVVRQPKKEAFEKQFAAAENVSLTYENEKFAVYVSDRNFVSIP